jgi:hypothetical protein
MRFNPNLEKQSFQGHGRAMPEGSINISPPRFHRELQSLGLSLSISVSLFGYLCLHLSRTTMNRTVLILVFQK